MNCNTRGAIKVRPVRPQTYLEFAEYDAVARLTDIAVALMAPMSAIFVGDDELSKMYLTVLKV